MPTQKLRGLQAGIRKIGSMSVCSFQPRSARDAHLAVKMLLRFSTSITDGSTFKTSLLNQVFDEIS